MKKNETNAERRARRVRAKLRKINRAELPRLSVNRTGKQIYAQVIDDVKGQTLAAASTLEAGMRDKLKSGSTKEAAGEVGKLLAERATKAGVKKVLFDRGPYLFHGRVKSLADGAREGGLKF